MTSQSRSTTRWLGRLGAELGVIIVGVLIALWADGWVADRADRRVEVSRIEALRDNLSGTRARLDDARREAVNSQEALQRIARWTDASEALEQEGTVLRGLFFGPVFTPELNVYTDLKNSGDLALLRNAGLRETLARMEATLDRLQLLQADLMTVQQLRYDPFVLENFALVRSLGPLLGLEDLPEDPSPIPDLRELRNLALFKLDLVTQLLDAYADAEASIDDVEAEIR